MKGTILQRLNQNSIHPRTRNLCPAPLKSVCPLRIHGIVYVNSLKMTFREGGTFLSLVAIQCYHYFILYNLKCRRRKLLTALRTIHLTVLHGRQDMSNMFEFHKLPEQHQRKYLLYNAKQPSETQPLTLNNLQLLSYSCKF